mmetsp:Transcript_28801/g.95374  ORF Transcript_28801/g.95374 Transcript_28801/m.95374 type:complete len:315 (-) Transcript_28801:53-997(-)
MSFGRAPAEGWCAAHGSAAPSAASNTSSLLQAHPRSRGPGESTSASFFGAPSTPGPRGRAARRRETSDPCILLDAPHPRRPRSSRPPRLRRPPFRKLIPRASAADAVRGPRARGVLASPAVQLNRGAEDVVKGSNTSLCSHAVAAAVVAAEAPARRAGGAGGAKASVASPRLSWRRAAAPRSRRVTLESPRQRERRLERSRWRSGARTRAAYERWRRGSARGRPGRRRERRRAVERRRPQRRRVTLASPLHAARCRLFFVLELELRARRRPSGARRSSSSSGQGRGALMSSRCERHVRAAPKLARWLSRRNCLR